MKKIKNRKITQKKSWYLFIILGIVSILFAAVIAPFWNDINPNIPWASFGKSLLGFILAIIVGAYVFTIVRKKLFAKKVHKIVRVLTAVEFAFMLLIMVVCILIGVSSFSSSFAENNSFIVKVRDYNHLSSIVVGIAIWTRGFVEIFGAYYYDSKNENLKPYPVWYLLINILLLSVGPIFIFVDAIKDIFILYTFFCVLFMVGVILIVFGILSKPISVIVAPVEEKTPDEGVELNKVNTDLTVPEQTDIEKKESDHIDITDELEETKEIENTKIENKDVPLIEKQDK